MGFSTDTGYFGHVSEYQPENPLVSVTFPIHKFNEYANESLTSILNQSYKNIEVMFLDNSQNCLQSYFDLSDKRLKYFKLPASFGLAETLNFAIEYATGKYLARMDYDDISATNRICEQVKFMELNKDIAISGTKIEIIGESIDKNVTPGQVVSRELIHEDIVKNLSSKNAFFHPSVIFRLSEIRKYNLRYRASHDSAEDLDLWTRACRVVRLANIDLALVKYRLHPNQYSRLDGDNSNYIANKIRLRHTIWLIKSGKIQFYLGSKTVIRMFLKLILTMLQSRKRFKKFA
jgi:glycosyltransferase involved in cell wall biosynthesis